MRWNVLIDTHRFYALLSERLAYETKHNRFVNTYGLVGGCIPMDLCLEFWNKTAKDILLAIGYRNLTKERLMEIGLSIETIHRVKDNMRHSLGVINSRGRRDRYGLSDADESMIMTKLIAAGHLDGQYVAFTSEASYKHLEVNLFGGVDVFEFDKWLKHRTDVLVAYQTQVLADIHPIRPP